MGATGNTDPMLYRSGGPYAKCRSARGTRHEEDYDQKGKMRRPRLSGRESETKTLHGQAQEKTTLLRLLYQVPESRPEMHLPPIRNTRTKTWSPASYCWSYAFHADGNPKFKNIVKICKTCELWNRRAKSGGRREIMLPGYAIGIKTG